MDASLMFPLIMSIFVVIFCIELSRKKVRKQIWKQFAHERKLAYMPGTLFSHSSIQGSLSGYPLSIRIISRGGKNKTHYTQVTTSARRSMPAGMVIAQESLLASIGKLFGGQDIQIGEASLDSKLRFQAGSEETLIALFTHAPLKRAIRALTSYTTYSAIRGQEITLEKRGQVRTAAGLEALTQEAITLAAELDRARVRGSLEAAERLSLSVKERKNTLRMLGTYREQTVEVSVDLRRDTTTITVPLSGLPQQFSVVAGKQADAVRLGDPILDGMVSVRTEHPEQIAALLRDDALRGVLLAVVHAWPKSTVTNKSITLRLPHVRSSELETRLEEVTTLAAGLTRARPAQTTSRAALRETTSR